MNKILNNLAELTLLESRSFIILCEKLLKINSSSIKNFNLVDETKEEIKDVSAKKNFYDIFLAEAPDPSKKMKTIMLIRELTRIDLKVAKNLVENAPSTIKQNATEEEMNLLKKKFLAIDVLIRIETK